MDDLRTWDGVHTRGHRARITEVQVRHNAAILYNVSISDRNGLYPANGTARTLVGAKVLASHWTGRGWTWTECE